MNEVIDDVEKYVKQKGGELEWNTNIHMRSGHKTHELTK